MQPKHLLPRSVGEWAILVGNLIPLVGVLLLGWGLLQVLLLYVVEAAIVGLLIEVKAAFLAAGSKQWSIPDRVLNFIMFFVCHGFIYLLAWIAFLSVVIHTAPPTDESLLNSVGQPYAWKTLGAFLRVAAGACILLAVSHLVAFVRRVRSDAFQKLGFDSFLREHFIFVIPTFFVPMLLAIILNHLALDSLLFLLALITAKTGIDLWTRRRAHT